MKIVVVGLNHKSAPVELRERLAFTPSELGKAGRRLVRTEPVVEGVVVSTCNRVELYAVIPRSADPLRMAFRFWGKHRHIARDDIADTLYVHEGMDAVLHLIRVAGGLDSMVVGENEILGQVRSAYRVARESDTASELLGALFERALKAGRRIRRETKIARGNLSVGSVAARFAESVLGDLNGKTVLVVGAGEMAELIVKALSDGGANQVIVANRRRLRARELARRWGGVAVGFDELDEAMANADIVAAATGSPHVVISAERVRQSMPRRGGRPLFILDLAVPRDVEAAVGDMEEVYLYNIDDLERTARENETRRRRELDRCEELARDEAEAFLRGLDVKQVTPVIRDLRHKVEHITAKELDRALGTLRRTSPAAARQAEAAVRRIVNKLLHEPMKSLKKLAAKGEKLNYAEVVRELFGLASDDNGKDDDG